MPDTPPMLRGCLYSTHLVQRCPDFHPCRRCLQCKHYNRHSPLCQACEEVKPKAPHSCTEEQQIGIALLEEKMGAPWWKLQPSQTHVVSENSFNPEGERFTRMIREMANPNDVVRIRET